MKLFVSFLFVLVVYAVSVANCSLLGGWSVDTVSSTSGNNAINGAANKAVDLMNEKSPATISLVKVNSVRKQVVAGMKYDMEVSVLIDGQENICQLYVYHMVNNPVPGGIWSVEAHNNNDPCFEFKNSDTVQQEQPMVKRSVGLLGGEGKLSPENEGVKAAVSWVLEDHNARSNSLFRDGLIKISDVTKQVINGYRYRFHMTIGSTECRNSGKNKNKDLTQCPLLQEAKPKLCKVSVIHRLGKYEIENFDCHQVPEQSILGGDDHDYKPHGTPILGGDDHDYKPHGSPILGGDDHDYKPHGTPILGGDDHDYKPHGTPILGGDDHDYKPHGTPILGGDDHDYKPHGTPILGGDDHDYKPHGTPILGGDDHDYKPHGTPILGGDDHDYKPHGTPILGGDDHDYKPHVKEVNHVIPNIRDFLPKGRPIHAEVPIVPEVNDFLLQGQPLSANNGGLKLPTLSRTKGFINRMNILGGDGHDYVQHGGSSSCTQYKEQFETFKATHKKVYGSTTEESKRFTVFCENMRKVKHYQQQDEGTATYGATKFADMSEIEFKEQYLGFRQTTKTQRSWPQARIPGGPKPASWDWREHNAVTQVKNQGSCGSCWAFSTTGNIEGQWAIVNKKLFSLSEQELVDCDKIDEGCNGGLPSQAYEAIMKIGGLETESDYKYDGYGEKCQFNQSEVVVTVKGAVNISQNEDEMASWLFQNGPISIGINAFAMQFYMGGIAHPWRIFCDPSEDSLDHGVLIVGYGVESKEPYWIVKNSWGPDWGREGYYYVYRGDGTCGLNKMCTSAQVAKK